MHEFLKFPLPAARCGDRDLIDNLAARDDAQWRAAAPSCAKIFALGISLQPRGGQHAPMGRP